MAFFPVLTSFEVRQYGLFPGKDNNGVMSIGFAPGLTLVLGANGLGKTTLMTMLFRMLTGSFDLLLPSGSIGTAEVKAFSMGTYGRSIFASRVKDAAQQSTATLAFLLGNRKFSVTRSLANLALKDFFVDDQRVDPIEESYQRHVCASSSLASFGEWILVLRTMVFFFEDRRSLVWDPSAQRQLLRCLLLPSDQATRWTVAEREILELDTRMRNLQAALRREQRDIADLERKTQAAPDVIAALRASEGAAESLRTQQQELTDSLEGKDQTRHKHRLEMLRAQEEHDASVQDLERARLSAIEARFPNADSSMRYVFAKLMADDECLVCGTTGRSDARKSLIAAIDRRHCVVCDAVLNMSSESTVDIGDARIEQLRNRVDATRITAEVSKRVLDESTADYESTGKALARCAGELSEQLARITHLVKQLPPDQQTARKQHEELRSLEQRVGTLRASIKEKREAFTVEMGRHREGIHRFATSIKDAFESTARGFLLEDSGLSWSPVRVQVGQAGAEGAEPVEYPAFAVELSGGDFSTVVRRDGPEEVSESQREFIDLAFRMALIHVAADNHSGTIIIDAPESSLDAVFIDRAAAVLARFSNANTTNRLIATSNLAGSDLIPELLIAAESDATKRGARIVDLFAQGVPTRAMRELAGEYEKHRQKLFAQISAPAAP